jgi:hypothetical protein
LYSSENQICDGSPNLQSHHPRPDTATSIASDQILRILMENHSESLIETERDNRDSRAGDALLPKHFSDAKSLSAKSPLSVHQKAVYQQ